MDEPTRLVRDSADRLKLKVSLPGGRYQLSLDDSAVILLTDELGYSERDKIPKAIVPILVAMGDAWFPRERDVDSILDDLPDGGHLSSTAKSAVWSYVTSSYVQEYSVDRILEVVDRSPLSPIASEDLNIQSLPPVPGKDPDETDDSSTEFKNQSSIDDTPDTGVSEVTKGGIQSENIAEEFQRIPGIGPDRSAELAKTGYTSLEELAEARPVDIAANISLSEGVATVAIEGARELVGRVEPMEKRLEAQTGVEATKFEKGLSSLAAAGVPPSEASGTLSRIYGPTVGDVDAVSGVQAYFLWEAGYQTPKDLVDASTTELEEVYQVGSSTAPRIQKSAQDLLDVNR